MRAGHHPNVEAARPQNRLQEGAGRALAVGAGYVAAARSQFGVPQLRQQGVHPLQAELDAEAALPGYVVEGFLERQGRRSCSAFSVFHINIARVMGPTPPGTGLSQPAFSATAGSTSPRNLPSPGLMPTSTPPAPSFTPCRRPQSGRPR